MRRVLLWLAVAFALAGTARVVAPQWSPICATLTEEDDYFLWWLFDCADGPPKDPRT